MTPTELASRACGGDHAAEHALFNQAATGSLEAQRAILDSILLGEQMPTPEDVLRAELLARLAAAHGHPDDWRQLGRVLWLLAVAHREDGAEGEAHRHAVEAFAILRWLSDGGDGVATNSLANLAPEFPNAWAEAETLSISTLRVATAETAAPEPPSSDMLAAALASLPPLSRWETVKFWFADRALDLRLFWWRLQDAVAVLRG